MSPKNTPVVPQLPPERPNRKPIGVYIIAYGGVVMLIVALLGLLLATPTGH